MAYDDFMKSYEDDQQRALREEQARVADESARIDWMERTDQVASDDLLFAEANELEAPEDFSKNRLHAYYSKELGVETLDDPMLDQVLEMNFGTPEQQADVDGLQQVGPDYDTVLESLKQTKRWGSVGQELTPMELAKHEKLTAGDWLRSFSGHTTKFVYGLDSGVMRAMAAGAVALGHEDSKFYTDMMSGADAKEQLGQDYFEHMTEAGRFATDATSDEANEDLFAQNVGQLMVVVPLGIATGGSSWGVSMASVGVVNSSMLYNEAFEQARDEGQSDHEALKTAGLYTLAAAPAETIVDMATAGVFKPFVKYASTLSGTARRAITRTAIQSLTAAGPGGLVEGGQYALLNKLTNKEIDQGEFWATVRAGAILEGLGGSVTHAMGEVDTAKAKTKLRKDFRPVFGTETDAVVDRIFADGEPNNQLNSEVLALVDADFEAITLLGKKSELKKRTESASDAVFNEQWQQEASNERASLDEEIKNRIDIEEEEARLDAVGTQADEEGHLSPEDIVLTVDHTPPEVAESEGGPTPDAKKEPAALRREAASRRRDMIRIRKENKQRKADLQEAMTVDASEQQRSYLREDGVEVFEDGTPVEETLVTPITPAKPTGEDSTPVPVNRLDPNHPKIWHV